MFLFTISAKAASASLSVSSNSVYVGGTFKVTVKVTQAAAWNVHATATGPVKNCVVNQANASDDAMDTNKTLKAFYDFTDKYAIGGIVAVLIFQQIQNIFGFMNIFLTYQFKKFRLIITNNLGYVLQC